MRSWGEARSHQINRTHTDSQSHSDSKNQSLKPIIVERSTTTYTVEEQIHAQARELAGLKKRHALLMRVPSSDEPITRFKTPEVDDLEGRRMARRLAEFDAQALEQTPFAQRTLEAGQELESAEYEWVDEPPMLPEKTGGLDYLSGVLRRIERTGQSPMTKRADRMGSL